MIHALGNIPSSNRKEFHHVGYLSSAIQVFPGWLGKGYILGLGVTISKD